MIRRPVVIAGARPNFPKVAPLMNAFRGRGLEALLVHTGQHYDTNMSQAFFDALEMAEPEVNLGVGSGTHAAQTAAVMTEFEAWMAGQEEVDAVLVVGDVNSTVACALVAAKAGIPIGHVEAGLRSFDRSMPEEINRVVVDALATWLFTPAPEADENLLAEGTDPSRIHRVGNIMVDSLLSALDKARRRPVRAQLGLGEHFGLVTLHRPALVDDAERLSDVVDTLHEVGRMVPLVFPAHPRTRAKIEAAGFRTDDRLLRLIEPLGYLEFLSLQAQAALVLTDSGGIQEETSVLGVPCLTLRENTERPITITRGTNRLVGYDRTRILRAAEAALGSGFGTRGDIPLWDGHAADRIVDELCGPGAAHRFVPPAILERPSAEYNASQLPDESSPRLHE